jgi:CBS domain-containing protein
VQNRAMTAALQRDFMAVNSQPTNSHYRASATHKEGRLQKEVSMSKVKEILDLKGRNVWSIAPTATVYDAMRLMADKGVGALLVLEGEQLRGIISERDYARKVILQERSSSTTRVSEIMTARVAYAELNQNIEECMAIMTEERVRHLPVIEAGRVVGIISIGDLVKSIIDEQKFMIEQLVRYING